MVDQIVQFVAEGAPRALAAAIEEHARGRGAVSVIIVPWESDQRTLSMAVTLVKADGWAIEHTNLGTVKLTDLGDNRTSVALFGHSLGLDHPEREKLDPLLETLGRQIQSRFQLDRGPEAS
jgi:hypothetical protein